MVSTPVLVPTSKQVAKRKTLEKANVGELQVNEGLDDVSDVDLGDVDLGEGWTRNHFLTIQAFDAEALEYKKNLKANKVKEAADEEIAPEAKKFKVGGAAVPKGKSDEPRDQRPLHQRAFKACRHFEAGRCTHDTCAYLSPSIGP